MGHSGGGHLALWLVSRHKILKTSPLSEKRESRIVNAISLAGVSDLVRLGTKAGHGIVSRLIGGFRINIRPIRHGKPIELLPTEQDKS